MKKTVCLTVILILSIFGLKVEAEDKIEFEIIADYYGKYIWRGQNLSDDPVFQPGISAAYKNFTAGIWGNLETTSINNNSGEFTEWDYYLDYSNSCPFFEGVGYSVGIINYHFPSVVGDTTEVYWGLNFDLPLSPSVTLYHDIDQVSGTYASFAVGHSFDKITELSPETPLAMEIGASLGWASAGYNNDYWGVDKNHLNDLLISVSFPVELAGFTMAPSLNYSKLVNSDIKSGNDGDAFYAGISLSKNF